MFEYDANLAVTGKTGSVEIPINNLQPINLSDIFDGLPQFYAGSTFCIEEVLEIGCVPVDAKLIDVDFRWYPSKYYFGTWTLFDKVSSFGTNPENRGYIEDSINIIKRYSYFTIQGNPDVPIAFLEESAIDDCNFRLQVASITLPPVTLGQTYPEIANSIFKGRHTLQRVPLTDRRFYPQIGTVGLYVNVGAELTYVNYKAAVINAVDVDLAAFPVSACSPASGAYCDLAFGEFIGSSSDRFVTIGEAESYIITQGTTGDLSGGSITPSTWTCSIAPFSTYTYYVAQLFWIPS